MASLTYAIVHKSLRQAAHMVPGLQYYHGPLADRLNQQDLNFPLLWVEDDMPSTGTALGVSYTVGLNLLDVVPGPAADERTRLDNEIRAISACEQLLRYLLGQLDSDTFELLPEGTGLTWSALTVHRDYGPRVVGIRAELVLQGLYDVPCAALTPEPDYDYP